LYFADFKNTEFEAKVLLVINEWIVLDETAFYPTSGGQINDKGVLIAKGKECNVIDVIKQGPYILHKVDKSLLKEGEKVIGKINFTRREQMTQHHTATHIVNAAAKKVLGKHIYQAGASKTLEKARLDITHFDSLTKEQLTEIETAANEIVKANLPVFKKFMPRELAEAEYGFSIYQGGAVPGKTLRIVDVNGIDVEACGGTHLDLTGEAHQIKILKSSKIQDGIVRIEFAAGNAAINAEKATDDLLNETAKILGVDNEQIPSRVEELFLKWKQAKKAIKKKKTIDPKELDLVSVQKYSKVIDLNEQDKLDDILISKTAAILKTQKEHIPRTVKRFLQELEEFKKQLK